MYQRDNKSLQFIAFGLAFLCFCAAVGVIYTKHLNRQKHIELSQIQRSLDELDIEWSRLQIEESTFSEHGLIETVARQRLEMVFPKGKSVVVISNQ